jgi:hypothetical protein
MSRILVGVLQPGARLLGAGINGARRGVAMFDGEPRGVVVKNCPPQELAAECFCALLADALCVNSPPVGIVFEGETPLFASIDVQAPNLMQQFCMNPDAPNNAELQVLVDELVQWVGLGRLIALDVLVRNADRHPGNLLTDGQDYWAIDHGRTLDLFPYQHHKTYRVISRFSNALVCANIESSAISNALTFPTGCELPVLHEVGSHALVAAYAQGFAQAVASRLPSLASSIKGLL